MNIYLLTNKKKSQCLVSLSAIALLKEYNLNRHYMTNHTSKYETYIGIARESVVIDLKRKLQSQQTVITKATTPRK